MTAIRDYAYICDEDGNLSVVVPEHSEETRDHAAKVIADTHFEPWSEETEAKAIELLADSATAVSFTQHAGTSTDECGCDGADWWCESPGNGGETRDFWSFDADDIEEARELAERIPDDEDDETPAEVTS